MSPKLSYRWLLDIGGGPGTSIANYTVRSFQKPSFTVGVSEYLNINALLGGGGSYGGLITFTQIDSEGDTIETWTLWNPFISSINFGQANYASDELMTISVQIYYDFADFRLAHE